MTVIGTVFGWSAFAVFSVSHKMRTSCPRTVFDNDQLIGGIFNLFERLKAFYYIQDHIRVKEDNAHLEVMHKYAQCWSAESRCFTATKCFADFGQ